MHGVAGPDEIFLAPAQPADHVGLVAAAAPEIRPRFARQKAGYGVGFPQAAARPCQYRQGKIGIELTKPLSLPGRHGCRELTLDLGLQMTCRCYRKARIGIAAEVQFHIRSWTLWARPYQTRKRALPAIWSDHDSAGTRRRSAYYFLRERVLGRRKP